MNPGDVVVGRVDVGGLDVRTMVSELTVYESILKPYHTLVMTILDSSNMVNGILGRDDVVASVEFGQRGQSPYRGRFEVTSVERAKTASSHRVTTYTLTGYSRHMIRFPRVQRAYREVTATDVVTNLVQEYLSPDKPLVVRDPSRGVLGNTHMPYNVNGVMVHKAIRAALERAVGKGTAYLFFEDRDSMVVDTLENMTQSPPLFTYHKRPLGTSWLRDQVEQNFTIISLREDSRSDRTDRVLAENQVVNPLDVHSHTGSDQEPAGVISTLVNLVYDSLRPPTNLTQAMPDRKRVASEFDSQSMTLKVPLNCEMTVGRRFNVDLLAPRGDTSSEERDSLSGPLVATDLRHDVSFGRGRMMATTTIKGSRGYR